MVVSYPEQDDSDLDLVINCVNGKSPLLASDQILNRQLPTDAKTSIEGRWHHKPTTKVAQFCCGYFQDVVSQTKKIQLRSYISPLI